MDTFWHSEIFISQFFSHFKRSQFGEKFTSVRHVECHMECEVEVGRAWRRARARRLAAGCVTQRGDLTPIRKDGCSSSRASRGGPTTDSWAEPLPAAETRTAGAAARSRRTTCRPRPPTPAASLHLPRSARHIACSLKNIKHIVSNIPEFYLSGITLKSVYEVRNCCIRHVKQLKLVHTNLLEYEIRLQLDGRIWNNRGNAIKR